MEPYMPKNLLVWLALCLSLSSLAIAGPLEDGRAAAGRGDFTAAHEAWRPLAEAGDVNAQYNLATLYVRGLGVPEDTVEAMKWYRRAAEQGSADAQTKVGAMFGTGLGTGQDHHQAVEWFQRAANQGHAAAQLMLARQYFTGDGVLRDFILANMWANLAAGPTSQTWIIPVSLEEARNLRDTIIRFMTPEQLAEAQRRASEWSPKPER